MSVIWIINLPKAVANVVSRFLNRIDLAIRGFARGTMALALWKAYKYYQEQKRAQREREAYDQYMRDLEEASRIRAIKEAIRRQEEERKRQASEAELRRRQEELRRQKAFNEQRRTAEDLRTSRQWLAQCETLFARRATMTRIPDPPFWRCSSGCPDKGVWKACPHTIARVYQTSGTNLQATLHKERRKWHPDLFERCPESFRRRIKPQTTEMFKILSTLLDKSP
ncbi:hypothetical protein M011DRAFT_480733 [Sporormia fimetaria CBS 119925]|uniref:J domain-containing protein n=1 Tax=Sporormia fimetaria CBS 119925 TaxID=1340428 RepID=A0A6A6V350_9PLEO|nr:hypothetical protein M011DRAFT_480733 [Sporormia fimetaria CBS 119925]